MPATPDHLFAYLDTLGIAHTTHQHEAAFTVAESGELKKSMPGGHSKNLFMKDKDNTIVLISAEAHEQLKLNQLHKHIGTRRLSFASAELMEELLGVTPGSVTAFSLMNESAAPVRFIATAELMRHDPVNFHPLINTATTAISRDDFVRFVESTGRELEVIDFSVL